MNVIEMEQLPKMNTQSQKQSTKIPVELLPKNLPITKGYFEEDHDPLKFFINQLIK